MLLHVCCAPDLTISGKRLSEEGYKFDTYFYNPNIHPENEYFKREQAYKKLTEIYGLNTIKSDYNIKDFFNSVKHYDTEKRCEECIFFRLENTARKARELGYDSFSTTLLASPRKDFNYINEVSEKLSDIYKIKYIKNNFRKNNGVSEAAFLTRKYGLYRQSYCGCSYSIAELKKYQRNSEIQRTQTLNELTDENERIFLNSLMKKTFLKVPEDLPFSYLKKYGLHIFKVLKPRIIFINKNMINLYGINKSGRYKIENWKAKFILW
ncbi:MAG TPA: epoxyqueuosine reductase QueH [Tepiditoga sp.]|nr:epoxyqueuosine reductase QueH [Tepiditoga sp.]